MKVQILCSVSRFYEGNDPDKALSLADSALTIAQRINYKIGIGGAYGSVGSCLCTAGKYDESIQTHLKALKIFEELKSRRHITNTYNSLANAYMGLKNNDKAYEYFLKAYNIARGTPGNEFMVAVTSVGVGNMLLEKGQPKDAVKYFREAEKYFHDMKITNYEAMAATMIGETYQRDSNFVEAEKAYIKVVDMFRKSHDDYGLALNLENLGVVEMHKKNYSKAAEYFREAMELNFKRKAWDNIQNSAKNLADAWEHQNNPMEALKTYKIFMQYKDSVINTERNKAVAEAESKYENEKKEQQLQLQKSELEKTQLKVEQKNVLIYIFAGAVLIFLVLLFFVYKQYNEKKKANLLLINKNEEIERQKSLIEEKNKDITDSINYSRHIQQAIIPSLQKVRMFLPNSFVIFKPKDIVSGDFYLIEEVVGLIYLAVVDCTGHGVPGAMLSVFANSTIKNTIANNEFRDNPAAVLSDLCFQFKTNLQSHHTAISINDGVDMGLCIIDKKNQRITFAGAKNGLLMLRNNELVEFTADRWGISGSNRGEQMFFTNHVVDMLPGDKFYLGTDGFADQFGGPKGKKFKQKQLKDLLVNYGNMELEKQADQLAHDFDLWRGILEQIDDVTLIGFEV
jgi:tetratricopeptide (TPR) repeat protein